MENEKDLQRRVKVLEKKVAYLESLAPVKQSSVTIQKVMKDDRGPDPLTRFIEWMKKDFLMKLGAFFLLLALAWFVRYSFAQNWLGPIGRVSLGILAGLGVLGFGYNQIPKRDIPGQVLTATGSTMILITLSAAWFVYGFFDPVSLLGMMSLVVALTALIAVVKDKKPLAVLALIGGFIAPVLAEFSTGRPIEILLYILVLNLGMFTVVSKRGWRELILLSMLFTGVFSFATFEQIDRYLGLLERGGDYSSYYLDTFVGIPFGYGAIYLFMAVFFALFFVSGLMAVLRTQKVTRADLCVKSFNGFLILIWVGTYVPDEWRSITMTVVALAAVVAVYFLLKEKRIPPGSMYIQSLLALVALGAATAFELEGVYLIIAYSLEALAAVLIAAYVLKDKTALLASSFLHVLPTLMAISYGRFDSYWWHALPLFNENFFILLVIGFSLLGTSFVLWNYAANLNGEESENMKELSLAYLVAASSCGLILIWLSLHNLCESTYVARAIALVTYAIIGVSLIFNGVVREIKCLQTAGAVVIGGVALRLLLVEVWMMPLAGRVITFVLVGVLLVATAFFQKKNLK